MDQLEKLNQQILSARSTALSKVGLTEADLAKLNMLTEHAVFSVHSRKVNFSEHRQLQSVYAC